MMSKSRVFLLILRFRLGRESFLNSFGNILFKLLMKRVGFREKKVFILVYFGEEKKIGELCIYFRSIDFLGFLG